MRAVWLLVRADLRRRWPAVLALALLVGVAGGVVVTAAAGARRAQSAFDRFVAESRPGHVDVEVSPRASSALVDRIDALPQVEALGYFEPVPAAEFSGLGGFAPVAVSITDDFLRELERSRMLAGRLPDPDSPNEVMLGESTAAALDVGVGDTLTLQTFTPAQAADFDESEPAGPRLPLRVVGVGRGPGDLNASEIEPTPVILTPAFQRHYEGDYGRLPVTILRVRLASGPDDLSAFIEGVERLLPSGTDADFAPLTYQSTRVQDSLDVIAVGLGLFAIVAGLAGLVAVGLGVVRQVFLAASDQPVM
ncbi:MAG: ABC transporter permease, partial [Acidimicrobiia bacterium]